MKLKQWFAKQCGKKKEAGGAVTLEAALIMPLFLYCVVNMLTLFDAVRVQSTLYAALHQAGRETGIYAFDVRFGAEMAAGLAGADTGGAGGAAQAGANVLSTAYAASRVRNYMDAYGGNLSCVEGGAGGIGYLRSGLFSDGDIIDLVADYKIRPLLRVFPFTAIPSEVRYYGHAWTGYQIPGTSSETTQAQSPEETVYMAKTGTVFHRSASCTYLNPSARTVAKDSLASLRNDSGGKYYPCEVCGGGSGGSVVVTTYGDRYHSNPNCSALARTVRAVPVSEAAAYRPCSKCGGSH